jgi:hypothetical protein
MEGTAQADGSLQATAALPNRSESQGARSEGAQVGDSERPATHVALQTSGKQQATAKATGRHGFIKAKGDQLVFENGAPARFWGANLAANALFSTPRANIARQAHRMAKLSYNLIRIHQYDAPWAVPNIFVDNGKKDTGHLNPKALDNLDWWIKCLKDEGIYIWLDLNYNRVLKPADGVTVGWGEVERNKGYV